MMNKLIENYLQEQQPEKFIINDIASANWALKKLRAINEKKEEIAKIAELEIERITKWKDEELKQYEYSKQSLEGLLTSYYIREKSKDKRFKLSTPYGKVSRRKCNKWIYEDEEALKKYLKENDIEAIKIKEEIDKNMIKRLFKNGVNEETGEFLHGIRIEETENISVKAE
ncbi:hypothetical protein FDB42_12445 [Clostridium botulinum]|nr:hypothetical protein [Clostridium botulinum]NFO40889.1 hypothetical protein [Clostridium botulinum]